VQAELEGNLLVSHARSCVSVPISGCYLFVRPDKSQTQAGGAAEPDPDRSGEAPAAPA
jgi:hypothetical protein